MSLQNINIGIRLNLMLGTVVVLIISAIGIVALYSEYNSMDASMEFLSFEETKNLKHLIERDIENKQKFVTSGIKVAHKLLYQKKISLNSSKEHEVSTVNQMTKEVISVKIPEMQLGGSSVYHRYTFVDEVGEMLDGTATIFQRIPQGFTRISTNVIDKKKQRGVDTFIPNDSPVIKSMLKGEVFKGRALVLDDWCMTVYEPIVVDGEVQGMLYVGVKEKDLVSLKKVFDSKQYLKSGYPFLIAENGDAIIHPEKEGGNFSDTEFYKEIVNSGKERGKFYYSFDGRRKQLYFDYVPFIKAYVAVTYYTEDLNGVLYDLFLTIIIALVIGISVFILINRYVARSISKPIQQSVAFTEQIAGGDLSAELDIDQNDEVGRMAKALNVMVAKLKEVLGEINKGSENIASAGHQVSYTSMQMSKGANDQAASVEEVSSTMEEIVSNIELNSQNASNTKEISFSAQRGMKEVYSKSNLSVEATKSISQKIGVINDIAMQTNILSLNASVEAARAGAEGKGFSVIAEEVKKLADLSKKAADEIINLSEESLEIANSTGEKVGEMAPDIEKTTQLIQEIAVASSEQLKGAEQVNLAIQELNHLTQENASSSEELAASAEQLSSQADSLKQLVSFFTFSDNEDVIFKVAEPKQSEAEIIKVQKLAVADEEVNVVRNGSTMDGVHTKVDMLDKEFEKGFESF